MSIVKRSDPLIDVWDLPLFPDSFCATPVKDDHICRFWFIETPCMLVFNENTTSTMGRYLRGSHIWTSIVLVFCGLYTLRQLRMLKALKEEGTPFSYGGSLVIITALYSIVTGILTLVRYFLNISRILHLVGILHNVCEYMIMAHLVTFKDSPYRENPLPCLKSRLMAIVCFNLIVISFQFLVPSFSASFGWTRPFDTLMDISLVWCLLPKWLSSRKGAVKDFYRLPAIAATMHLVFTIIPTSFAILFSKHDSWFTDFFLEASITLSMPVTHILWCYWAVTFQETVWYWNKENVNNDGVKKESNEKSEENNNESAGEWQYLLYIGGNPSEKPKEQVHNNKNNYKATKYELDNVTRKIAGAFVIGWFGGWIFPILLGECTPVPHHCGVFLQKATSTSTFKARRGFNFELEKQLTDIRAQAENYNGNIRFQINKKVNNILKFQIHETWESVADLEEFRRSIQYERLLKSDSLTKLLDKKNGFKEDGIFVEEMPAECAAKGSGSFVFEVPLTCAYVKSSIAYFDLCIGVPSCTRTLAGLSSDNSLFEMEDGRIISGLKYNAQRKDTVVYEVKAGNHPLTGYKGTISKHAGQSKNSCIINYQFSIPLGRGSVPALKIQQAYEKDVPRYKRMLSRELPKNMHEKRLIASHAYHDEF